MKKPDFIQKVDKATQDQGLFVLVYGPAGAGKTTLCATTPDPERTLVISAEGGTLSIRDSLVDCANVNKVEDFFQVYRWLNSNPDAYDWVCIDSISEIADVCLAQELEKNRDARRAYGEMASVMLRGLRAFRDLPCNVYVVASEKRKDDDGRLTSAPDTPGNQLANKLPYLFDEVLYLHVHRAEDGEIKRALLTQHDGVHIAKDRSGRLDQWEKPDLELLEQKLMGSPEG